MIIQPDCVTLSMSNHQFTVEAWLKALTYHEYMVSCIACHKPYKTEAEYQQFCAERNSSRCHKYQPS